MSRKRRIICGAFAIWGYLVAGIFFAHTNYIGGSVLSDFSRHTAVVSHGQIIPVTPDQWITNYYISIAFLIFFPVGFIAGMVYVVKAALPDLGLDRPAKH